jgi:hypothetical protein
MKPGTSGSVARDSDPENTEAVSSNVVTGFYVLL